MYNAQKVSFLIEESDDPDEAGEEEEPAEGGGEGGGEGQARKRPFSMMDMSEQAFFENPQINHANKLNLITGFSDMKSELKDFLRTFAETGKVVTEADIAEFFEELRKKRQRTG